MRTPSAKEFAEGEREEFSRAESLDEKKRISSLSPKAKRPPSLRSSSPSASEGDNSSHRRRRTLLSQLYLVALFFYF